MLKSSVTALALGVALVSGSAMAYEAGDLIVRAGAAAVGAGTAGFAADAAPDGSNSKMAVPMGTA